jgi:ABC-2 type transport system permease protein
MSTQSDAIHPLQETVAVPVTIPASRRLYWSVRRELWEYRSIYLAPLAVAALLLIAYLFSVIRGVNFVITTTSGTHQVSDQTPYTFAAFVLMGISFIVTIFYCLDTLYGERRDRSILFWKSLPVSDLTAVLGKATIPLLILPLITFVLTIVTQWIMLLMSSAVMLASGRSVATLWHDLPLFQMSMMLLFHLVAIHGLQFAPVYCWLLLVSAWAPRAPLLWAVLPPLGIGVAEKIAFNTTHFAHLMHYLLGGGPETVPFTAGRMEMAPLTLVAVGRFFSNSGLWVGLAVAAAFLAAAVRVRRSREPI